MIAKFHMISLHNPSLPTPNIQEMAENLNKHREVKLLYVFDKSVQLRDKAKKLYNCKLEKNYINIFIIDGSQINTFHQTCIPYHEISLYLVKQS